MFSIVDDSILRDILSKQITHLNIDIKNPDKILRKVAANIFVLILSLCKKLIELNFCDLFFERKHWSLFSRLPATGFASSTLVKLRVNVYCFTECLFLLDAHLESLATLIIHVEGILPPPFTQGIDNTVSRNFHYHFYTR